MDFDIRQVLLLMLMVAYTWMIGVYEILSYAGFIMARRLRRRFSIEPT